jgi:enhancing lycopene biosynthesis protein 2
MKFAIILAGCGQHDGSETHEVITTLLSMEQEGIEWLAFAPDRAQQRVINHVTNQEDNQPPRNILLESSRLVRGRIKALSDLHVNDFDAIIFPGGYGAVTNWCNWLTQGTEFMIEEDIRQCVEQAKAAKLAFGFICIAPVMITKLFNAPTLTIGNDKDIAEKITQLNATHIDCTATDVVVDHANRVVSTPANMLANNLVELHTGIHKLIETVASLAEPNASEKHE